MEIQTIKEANRLLKYIHQLGMGIPPEWRQKYTPNEGSEIAEAS